MRLAAARRLLLSPPRPPPARRSFAASASACSSAAPDDAGPRTSGRNLLARYAPGAPPIPSASDVPLEQLLDRTAAVGAPAGDVGRPDELVPSPSSSHEQQQQQQLDRPSPDRPRVEMQDVLTPAHPAKGDGRMVVAGVEVPVKPERPGDEDCCMSGCAICIYDIYADSLLEYNTALRAARKALLADGSPRASWPAAVRDMDDKLRAREERAARRVAAKQESQDDASGESQSAPAEAAAEEMDDTLEDMDPTMRAFLEFEGKLKKAKQVAKGA